MGRRDDWGDDSAPQATRRKKVVKKKVVKKPAPAAGTATKKKAVKKAPKKKAAKKTKKQVHDETHAVGAPLLARTSAYLEQTLEDARAETGDLTICTMQDAGRLIVGIPWPSFCLEYATLNTVLPLEKYLQIYGPTGIGKSGITFEIMRWARKLYGIGHFLEHETKFNGDWATSIIGYRPEDRCLGVIPCDSPEDWQKWMLKGFAEQKKIMTGDKKVMGAGRIYPYVIIVDSLMAKLLRESQKKIETDGFAGRGHPIEALSITRFLMATAHKMRGWPFLVVTVNHDKEKKDDQGRPDDTRAGGKHVNFQGSFEFKLQRFKRIRTAKVDGNRLRLTVNKNSYGTDKRSFLVDTVWWDEEYDLETNGPLTDATQRVGLRQRTIFDWHGATVRLLLTLEGADATAARKLCSLTKKNDSHAYAPKLGVPKGCKDEKKTAYNFIGRRLMRNREMVEGLRDIFQVRRRKAFQPGVEFTEQILSEKIHAVGEGGDE